MSWLTLLPTALEARISDLQKNPPVDTETIRAWAEHQQIYEKFREPSNVPKKLAARLKKYGDSLLASRKRGIRHLPTIITVEMDIPEGDGMDNEDDAVDAVDEALDEEAVTSLLGPIPDQSDIGLVGSAQAGIGWLFGT